MSMHQGAHRWLLAAALLVVVSGCGTSGSEDATWVDPATIALVPVGGTITLDGQPLKGAVVTFLPESGSTSVGETDAEGRYTLQTYSREGVSPGEFKVSVSYLLSTEGEPQSLADQGSMSPPASMLTAQEALRPEFADLGRTELRANVGPKGGQFDFDVEAVEGRIPTPKAEAAAPGDETGDTGDEPDATGDEPGNSGDEPGDPTEIKPDASAG